MTHTPSPERPALKQKIAISIQLLEGLALFTRDLAEGVATLTFARWIVLRLVPVAGQTGLPAGHLPPVREMTGSASRRRVRRPLVQLALHRVTHFTVQCRLGMLFLLMHWAQGKFMGASAGRAWHVLQSPSMPLPLQ